MKVLFIGDIMGEPGRRAIARRLPKLVADHKIDIVFGNGENAAGGFGITPEPRLLRPANYPEGVPGRGSLVVETPAGERVAVLQLMGRAFMPTLDCPFQVGRREVDRLKAETRAIIVDMHAEASSEKMAMGHYLDGDVSAVVGTHTHVQTADEQILPNGTAYLTDIGMTGPIHSVIGIKKELAIEKFLTGMPRRFEVATGPAVLSAVLIELDSRLGKAIQIQRFRIPD
jgi:metallophosphoesterase (TIGR00282 family)